MMSNTTTIFSSDPCISMKEMVAYIGEELPVKERNRVERHLLDCGICQEALEGLSLIKDTSRAAVINDRILKEIKRRGRISFEWRKAAAVLASGMLIAGGGYYLNEKLNSTEVIAVNHKLKEDTAIKEGAFHTPGPEADSMIVLEREQPHGNEFLKKEQKQVSDGPQPVEDQEQKESLPAGKADKVVTVQTGVLSDTVVIFNGSAITNVQSNAVTPSSATTEDAGYTPQLSFSEEKEVNKVMKESKVSGNQNMRSANYSLDLSKASRAPENAKKKVKGDDLSEMVKDNQISSAYYQGMGYYNKGEYQKALEYFEKVTPPLKESEDARWYSSLCYLKLDNILKAKALLEEISSGNGPYRDKAAEELKKLK